MTAVISESSPTLRARIALPGRAAGQEAGYGREPEQRIVHDLLRRAQQGAGGVLLVEGEPGIGKSLLLRNAISEAARQGFSLAAGAADQLGRALPLFALRTALGEPFAKLIASAPDRDLPDAPGWWISQMRAHLEQRARATPVLVCLDDLQWASHLTLAAVRTLSLELKHRPVAWILSRTSAAQQDTEYLFGLLEKHGAPRITLAPLGEDAVADMLTAAFSASPDEALAEVARDAAGNPALLAELICGLDDDRAVQVAGDRAVLVSARLPARVHRAAQRRLDGLSKQTRHLLVTAAVLGPSFRLEDAAEMLGETPAALLPTVEEAMSTGIVTAADNAFVFRHQLLRRAIGEMIPRPARSALHRQYGQLVLGRGKAPGLAAGHLLQAAHPADPASLADLSSAAAQILGSAPQTAARLAQRALELTAAADPAALPRAVAAAEALAAAGQVDQAAQITADMLARPLPPAAEARLRCALASVLCARGQARDAADQAELVLAQPNVPHDLAEEALTAHLLALTGQRRGVAGPLADVMLASPDQHDSHTLAAALAARAGIAWDSGQLSDALHLLREAARHASAPSPDGRHPQPLLALAAALIDLRQLGEANDILRAADHSVLQAIPAHAGLCLLRARVHLASGRLADAARATQAALATAEELGAHVYAATAHSLLSVIELRRGDLAAAARHLSSRELPSPQFADSYARAEATWARAQLSDASEGPAAAISHIHQAGADLPASQALLSGDPAIAAWLVRTALAADDQPLASQVAGSAWAIAHAHPGFPALTAAAAHSRGLATRDTGLLAQAATQHPDPWTRASAAEDLAILLIQTETNQATGHLEHALSGYFQAGAERDQARIRRRLRKLGIRRRHWATPPERPVTGWDSLTGTEQAVAGLVAQGLSNNQVAARMYISPHTVAYHLRQVFPKLSITSRVGLTRIVVEQAADSP